MSDIKFIQRETISLGALAEEIKKVEDKKEPVAVQQKVKDYAIKFSKVNKDKEAKFIEAIRSLEIPLLTDAHAIQIVNLAPENLAELQTVFAGTKTTISPENLTKLQEVIKAHEK